MTRSTPSISIAGLALVSSVGAFGVHLLLPALPAIREEFAVSSGQVQLVVSLSLIALALGALVNGPLSDRFGRRPVALAGLVLYVGGSLLGWAAQELWGVLLGRVVQAVGGGAAITVVRALIRDLYERDAAASILGYMASFVLVVPLLVPLLGGLVAEHFGWRANFLVAVGVGAAVWSFVLLRLPETRGQAGRAEARVLADFAALLRSRAFLGYALVYSFSMAALQAFLAGAPLLLIGRVGLSASSYGTWYMVAALASMGGFFLAGRLSRQIGVQRMLRAGLVVSVLATVSLLCVQGLLGWISAPALMLLAMGHTFANALMGPSSTSGAISERPDQAGAAAGLLGFLQFLVSAAAAQLTGVLLDYTDLGVAIVMAGGSLVAASAYLLLVPRGAPVQALPQQAE